MRTLLRWCRMLGWGCGPLQALACRMTGRGCTAERPSSRDLVDALRHRGRAADAQAAALRRRRAAAAGGPLDSAMFGRWGRREGGGP